MKMGKCKICKDETENIFNIEFQPVNICERCADTITLQQISYIIKTKNNPLKIKNPKKLKIQIVKSSKSTFWYNDKINDIYNVLENDIDTYIYKNAFLIHREDCTILNEIV